MPLQTCAGSVREATAIRRPRARTPEGGAALVVGLIILGVMTVLGLGAMRGSALEERMAGNLQDRHDALQAAEAAMQAAVTFIVNSHGAPPTRAPYGSRTPILKGCRTFDSDTTPACALEGDFDPDWLGSAETAPAGAPFRDYANTPLGTPEDAAAWPQPRLMVIHREVQGLSGQLMADQGAANSEPATHYFTISAVATGRSGKSRVVLQTTIPKVYD